jgi:predicted AAA+ superfamily ATPase
MQKRGGAFAAGCACGSYHLQAVHRDGYSRKHHRYSKYVVTLNDMDAGIENGIKIVHLQDFLLAEMW